MSTHVARLSKAIPLVAPPLLILAVVVATRLITPLPSATVLMGNGQGVTAPGGPSLSVKMSLALLDALTAIALWDAPIHGWLVLVSGWAQRATFLWAVLASFASSLFETMAFRASHLASLLPYRPFDLWVGLGAAAVFLAAAVRLHRRREPVSF